MSGAWVDTRTLWNVLFNNGWGILRIEGSNVVIVVISIEQSLHTVPSEKHRCLPHLVFVVIFPITVCIFWIKIVLLRWDKWRLEPLIVKTIPVVVLKPHMLLHFLWSIQAKSVNWLSLDKFVDKISSFKRPTSRHFVLPDLHLLRENMISDFLSVLSEVWSFAKHAFKSNDSNCEIVNSYPVILSAHYFRCYFKIEWKINKLPMYPGVPDVSFALSGFHTLAIPKSVILM